MVDKAIIEIPLTTPRQGVVVSKILNLLLKQDVVYKYRRKQT